MRTIALVLLLAASNAQSRVEFPSDWECSQGLTVSPAIPCGYATVPVPATFWLMAVGVAYLIRRK